MVLAAEQPLVRGDDSAAGLSSLALSLFSAGGLGPSSSGEEVEGVQDELPLEELVAEDEAASFFLFPCTQNHTGVKLKILHNFDTLV